MSVGQRFTYNTSIALGGYAQQGNIQPGPTLLQYVPHTLHSVSGFNPTGNDGYLMVFNVPVADLLPGDEPVLSFAVPAGGSFAYASMLNGLAFDLAISFAVSTQGDVYAASADEWWVLAEGYEGASV